MKRNLLLLGCLLSLSMLTFGQNKKRDLTKLYIPGSAVLRVSEKDQAVKLDYKQLGAPLPGFAIFNHENTEITKNVLATGGNILVMMFNPTCDHCEDQTILFGKNDSLFKKSKVLLVAAPMQIANMGYFEANVGFSKYAATMTVAVDSVKLIERLFNYIALPQINIYDGKTHRLLKTYNGLQPLDSLRGYIQ